MIKLFIIILIVFFIIQAIPAQEIISSGSDSIVTGEILVESNRLKMKNSEAPNKIQVLDEYILKSLNGGRLNDALEMTDAMFIKDYGFNSGIKTISLNANQSEHTLILVNGIKLNSRQNAQVDLSLYDLDNVKRIEVSKGGSSALYGSEAIGGVINIITKDPDMLKPFYAVFKGEFGSYGLRKFYGKLQQAVIKNMLSYSLSYSDERAGNNYRFNFKNGLDEFIKERENADYNTQSVFFNADLSLKKKSLLNFFTSYSFFERGVPGIEAGYSPGTARQLDYVMISSVNYSKDINKKIHIKSGIDYKYSLQKYFDAETFTLQVKLNSFYKLNSYIHSSSIGFDNSSGFGAETGYEISMNNISSNETETGELVQGALFAASKYEFTGTVIPKITIYPSVRYDYFSNINQKNVITGKFGINIKPLEKTELHIKSSIGNNFAAPTFNELYWKDLGNKDLRPEKSVCIDAGIYYMFNFAVQNEIELSYYNISTTDRIVWTPVTGSIWKPVNIGRVKSEGIDVSVKSGIKAGSNIDINLRVNYTYGVAVKKNIDFPGDPSYNKQLIYLPEEMVKSVFVINYLTTSKLLKSVSLNLFYRFATRRYTNLENTSFIPRYDVADANLGFGFRLFNTGFNIKLAVNNILNEDYSVLPGYPMPLRNYRIEFKLEY